MSMDTVELSYWMAFSQLEPLDKSDLHAALICTVVANCLSTKEHKLSDFILNFEPQQPSSVEEVKAYFRALASR